MVFELQHEAFAQIARPRARRVELLDDPQHLFDFRHRVGRNVQVLLRLGFVFLEELVRAFENLLDVRLQVAVFPDVAQELLGEQLLAWVQVEHPCLVA